MDWDPYLLAKTLGIAVFIFAGGVSASRHLSLSLAKTFTINLLTVLSGFVVSRLWFILQHAFGREAYGVRTILEAWNDAGSVLYGWILGGFLAIVVLTKWLKIPTVRYFDRVLPWLLIAQALNRLGCFDAGCCYGDVTTCPIFVLDMDGVERLIPVQLYEAAVDAGLAALIWTRAYRRGLSTLIYFTGYPAARFFLEFWRGDNQPALGILTVPQVASLLVLLAVFTWRKNILEPKSIRS